MRVNGLYFNSDEAKMMLKNIEAGLPPNHKKAITAIKIAMDDSAGRGMNGEMSCTATAVAKGYQATANVCCGGYAEVTVTKSVKTKTII